MIWFDNLRSYGTPNYYVQKMFSVNKGTRELPVLLDGSPKNRHGELYASASVDEAAGEVIVKLVNTGSAEKKARITLGGARRVGPGGKAFVLQSEDLKAENSLDHPTKVAPVEKQLQVAGSEFSYSLLPRSFTVLRIPAR
jgi:alpha-N-arabinofuranosidase